MRSLKKGFSLLETIIAVLISGILLFMLIMITESSVISLNKTNTKLIGLDQMQSFHDLLRSVFEKGKNFTVIEGGIRVVDNQGNTHEFVFQNASDTQNNQQDFVVKVYDGNSLIEKTWLSGLDNTTGLNFVFYDQNGDLCSGDLALCELRNIAVFLTKIQHGIHVLDAPVYFSTQYPVFPYDSENKRVYSLSTLPNLYLNEVL